MTPSRQIDHALAEAAVEINRQLPKDRQLGTGSEVVLAGEGGVLDSLGLLSFLIAVEQQIEVHCGVQLALVGADLTGENGPLSNLGALARYLLARLEEP